MTDDSSYADALAEIHALRSRLAGIEAAAGINPAPVTYTVDQLSDADYYRRHKEDIHRALGEPGAPRIVESAPIALPAPVTVIDPETGWQVIGQDQYLAPEPAPKAKGQKP